MVLELKYFMLFFHRCLDPEIEQRLFIDKVPPPLKIEEQVPTTYSYVLTW